MRRFRPWVLLFVAAFPAAAQSTKSFVGTVAGVDPSTAAIQVKADQGAPVLARITAETILEQIAPGEKDLKKAEPIPAGKIAVGDRVLVTLDSAGAEARRIVVMSAEDINKRNQADQQDWITRGLAGVVAKNEGDEITLTVKSSGGNQASVVSVNGATVYRRYAPDSVKFADAKPSRLAEIQIGDQLRARGQKSANGTKVTAEEIVFGTFVTKAGTVVSVDAASREIRLNELGTAKPLLVRSSAP